jgi:hypothetical protein
VFNKRLSRRFSVPGSGLHQLTVKDIGGAPDYKSLPTKIINFTESSTYGVFVKAPANNSTQATLFPRTHLPLRRAEESNSGIDHIEVWNGNTKLGGSPKGTSISQWVCARTGPLHSDGARCRQYCKGLHESNVSFTALPAEDAYLNSPTNNSTWSTTTVPISA